MKKLLMQRTVNIVCRGKVQGVFFRATTRANAMKIGIKGWVKNMPDGTVLLYAQGSGDQLEKLITWCHTGPEGAVVTEVEVQETSFDPSVSEGFSVRY